jgi:ABC-2 type transport system ATP-binding protein
MSNSILELCDVRKHFAERCVLDGISFVVERGQTLGLLGPNGAGKSSTVKMICGLLNPDSGTIQFNGSTLDKAAKQKIGFVPQELALYEELSSIDNLHLFGALYGLSGKTLQSRCDAVLELINLKERAKERVVDFSGGMKRRLNIGAALLHQPELLILDEPTVGVDPQSRNAIFDCIETLNQAGMSLIYTSHYMEEVERLAQHIVILDHGKVIANETPDALYKRLPAQAALNLHFTDPLTEQNLSQLAALEGVLLVKTIGQPGNIKKIALQLVNEANAFHCLQVIHQLGLKAQQFSTSKTNLEEIFLNLTGRSLRD